MSGEEAGVGSFLDRLELEVGSMERHAGNNRRSLDLQERRSDSLSETRKGRS